MQRIFSSLILLSMFGLLFSTCKKDDDNKPTGGDKPVIEDLAVTPSSAVSYGDVITLTGKFTDATGLSNYTVTMSNAQGTLFETTGMLTGKDYNLDVPYVLPLPKNAQAGDVTISVALKNSGNQTETKEVKLTGVAVPTFEKLYLVLGSNTHELIKDEETGLYVFEGLVAANAAGKIYAKADRTGLFWGWENNAVTTLAEGNISVGIAEATTLIISFDITTFELVIEEGEPWEPIDEAIYIYGNISGHWADGNITEEMTKMKMSGFASGDKKYWTWTPPENCEVDGCLDGMWGNINPGQFRFKIGGEEKYILFDGSKLVEGTTNDEAQSFLVSTGGHVIFTLYYDGTQFNRLLLEVGDKSLDYTNDGFVINGLPLPASMTFAGGTLTKREGTFWVYEGLVTLTNDVEFTATGVDLSKAKPDMDVFMGGSATWKMIGSSGEWLIRVDPFVYDVYACKQSGYPDVIYMDGWGWEKFAENPATNWAQKYLCLQRVNEESLIYEATFFNFGWGDGDVNGPDVKFFGAPQSVENFGRYIIPAVHFADVEPDGGTGHGFYIPRYEGYMKVRVDLKDGIEWNEEDAMDGDFYTTNLLGAKFTVTFTEQ